MIQEIKPRNGLESIRVKREELLKRLYTNRASHRHEFTRALEGYKRVVLTKLEESLADARAGRKYISKFYLVEPVDHTSDYDRIIDMMQMSLDDELWLTQTEFSTYVRDDWQWKEQFTSTNASYT